MRTYEAFALIQYEDRFESNIIAEGPKGFVSEILCFERAGP